MSFFEEAKIVFKKNNYLQSAKLFEKSILEDELSLDDQVFALEKIVQIHNNLKKETPLNLLFKLGDIYRSAELNDKGKKHYLHLYEKTGVSLFLQFAFRHYI